MGLSTRFYCLSDCSQPIMLKSGDEQAILGTSFCPNEIRGICTLLHNLSSARNLLRCGKIFVKPLLVAQNFRDENSTTMTSARTCDIRAYIYNTGFLKTGTHKPQNQKFSHCAYFVGPLARLTKTQTNLKNVSFFGTALKETERERGHKDILCIF